MESKDDILSEMKLLQDKMGDLEARVGQILMKQLQTKKEIDLIKEITQTEDKPLEESKPDLQLPDSYHFTDELQSILQKMMSSEKSMQESAETVKNLKTGLGGLEIFKEMSKNISDRLEYLETVELLIKGPLLEDPPQLPEEEKSVVEIESDDKASKKDTGKIKKDDAKKGKKK